MTRNDLFLFIVLGALAVALIAMGRSVQTVESKGRPTPTPCRAGVEGRDFCPDGFATSVVRPGEKNVPRKETPTTKRGK